MAKLQREMEGAIREMGCDDGKSRLNARIYQVKERFRMTLEKVYKDKADVFLKHINSVYIMDKEGVKTLIVYVDESIFAAELNAQRELIRLVLLETFKEQVEEFDIRISRGEYRQRHPYTEQEGQPGEQKAVSAPSKRPLDEREEAYISDTVSVIEDARLREAVKRAMTADFQQDD